MTIERKIYTKGGDQGETSLLGGTRISKGDDRVEAYGNLDELNSFIGLICDQDIDPHSREILRHIQEVLFISEALVSCDPGKKINGLPVFTDEDTALLEKEIDVMNEKLPELRNFILPGGHQTVSFFQIARTVCRRAERSLIRLHTNSPVDEKIIRFLNRLSDYLFVTGRKIGQDLGAVEKQWTIRR